jgi:hypothetical protein
MFNCLWKWHYRVKSWVIFNKGQFTHICQLNVSCGQDSVSVIVLWRTINLGRQISDISKKSMQATIYCHYD